MKNWNFLEIIENFLKFWISDFFKFFEKKNSGIFWIFDENFFLIFRNFAEIQSYWKNGKYFKFWIFFWVQNTRFFELKFQILEFFSNFFFQFFHEFRFFAEIQVCLKIIHWKFKKKHFFSWFAEISKSLAKIWNFTLKPTVPIWKSPRKCPKSARSFSFLLLHFPNHLRILFLCFSPVVRYHWYIHLITDNLMDLCSYLPSFSLISG